MIDYLFLTMAVCIAIVAPRGKFRWISMILVADFCVFIGFDEIWLASNIPGGDWMLPYKGFVYLAFFMLYGMVGSIYLSLLSGMAALYHSTGGMLEDFGIYSYEGYTTIMTIYCILQLLGAFSGVLYGYYSRYRVHYAWRHHHNPGT